MYRFALVQSLITIAISLLGLLAFWLEAGRAAGPDAAYSRGALVAYFLIVSAHSLIQENRLSWNLSAAIRMGKLSASMLRPFPFLFSIMAQAAAYATVRLVLIVPVLAILGLAVPPLGAVLASINLILFTKYALAFAVAIAIGWLVKLSLGMLAFDLTQTWGPELIFIAFSAVSSGIVYPSDLLTGVFHGIVVWTPFYYMIGFPALVLLGRVQGPELWIQLGHGVILTGVMALIATLMWRRGLKRFEAVGI
jgi:ABC-2 type transport system permease protein